MAIKINGQDLLKRFINGQEIVRVYKNGGQIRPETVPPVFSDYFSFTANQSYSSVALNKIGNPTEVQLEYRTNWYSWRDYTWDSEGNGYNISLPDASDVVYFRNKSATPTGFSTSQNDYYQFSIGRSVLLGGDVTSLICKDGSHSIQSSYSFYKLFSGCSLAWGTKLPATTLTPHCYERMFENSYVSYIPNLPATTLADSCYFLMFQGCPQIKLSETQTGEYQTAYRIPSSGMGVDASYSTAGMLSGTGGTFTNDPSINTTYYTSNQVI